MKLTIIVDDNAVYVNNFVYLDLNLSTCEIPNDVHALQWNETNGHIEFVNACKPNENIEILPSWALMCVEVWNKKDYQEKNPPAPTPEQLTGNAVLKRNNLLLESDWTQLPDVPLTEQKKMEWSEYRQLLREITDQSGFPQEIIWPTPPN